MLQAQHKLACRAHGPDGVGAAGADPYFEEVKDGDGHIQFLVVQFHSGVAQA
jgi:hypothetical protein